MGARFSSTAVHRGVAEARRRWAASRGYAFTGDQPAADPATVVLLLSRGRHQPQPIASMRGTFGGRPVVAETWELRSVATSKRQTTYHEVVVLKADTRSHRCAVDSQGRGR